jgi:aryl-alcohol dehydrogenase-like predicted oxidoreductase/NAD-dependent dihydropyrimidine dehydrogenase PreA subunit
VTGMRKATLGTSGIEVTELGHGTLIFGCLQAQMPTDEGAAALCRSYELGVRFVDTAQAYDSYRHIRRFLDDVRPRDVVLASKSHARTFADMTAAVDEALRELNVERLDIMHLHALKGGNDLRDRWGSLEALVKCREQGKIRAIGISTHSADACRVALRHPDIQIVHPILNRQGLGLVEGTHAELLQHLRALKAGGRGIYAMKAFGGGHLIRDMENALAYVRGLGLADAVVVGMKTPAEVEVDVRLFKTGRMSAAERARTAGFHKSLVVYDACRRCGRCVDVCQQHAMSLGEKKAVNDPARCVLCGYCAEACPGFCIRVI